MRLETEHVPFVVIITALEDSKGGQSDLFADAMAQCLADGVRNFVVDLAGLSYIDEPIIGDLISAAGAVAKRGSQLVLVLPERVLERHQAELDKRVDIWSLSRSREEAIEELILQSRTNQMADRASRRARTALRLSVLALQVAAISLLVTVLTCSEMSSVSAALR